MPRVQSPAFARRRQLKIVLIKKANDIVFKEKQNQLLQFPSEQEGVTPILSFK